MLCTRHVFSHICRVRGSRFLTSPLPALPPSTTVASSRRDGECRAWKVSGTAVGGEVYTASTRVEMQDKGAVHVQPASTRIMPAIAITPTVGGQRDNVRGDLALGAAMDVPLRRDRRSPDCA